MKKILFKNFWIKLFCLFSACVLWIYVAAGQNSVGKYPGNIKIKAINVASGLQATYDTKDVQVKIMAEPSVWNKLSVDSFSAYTDMANLGEGTYEVSVNVVCSTPGVQIVEKNPDQIFVNLQKIISKDVPVNKRVEGSAAEGLVAGTVEYDPPRVTVQGPKSLIESISEAIVDIKLNGESEKFVKKYALVALDEKNNPIDNVSFNPAEVSVSVPIVKASNNKTVGVRVVTSGAPKTGYFVSNISATPSVVDITGPVSIISTLNYLETSKIDITNLDISTDIDSSLKLPDGISLQVGTSTKVKVHFDFSKIDISKEFTLSFNPEHLPNGYQITSYTPNQVKVICSGPADLINSLQSADIVFNLDFSDKKLLDAHNVISFDILPNNIKAREGISITSILPSSISVAVDRI